MISITKKFTFEASHRLLCEELSTEENQKVFGKCFDPPSHGHSYKLFVSITGEETNGMIMNFTELKKIINHNIIEVLDHRFLNNIEMFKDIPTTCENMIGIIAVLIIKKLPKETKLKRLVLFETEDSCAEWENENM